MIAAKFHANGTGTTIPRDYATGWYFWDTLSLQWIGPYESKSIAENQGRTLVLVRCGIDALRYADPRNKPPIDIDPIRNPKERTPALVARFGYDVLRLFLTKRLWPDR